MTEIPASDATGGKGELYTCAGCKVTFRKLVSDVEAEAEYKHNFPKISRDSGGQRAIVCDDCYRAIMALFVAPP